MNRTKDDIYKSAIEMFSIKGYCGTTMCDVSSNAGITKGTLYYHFKSKEEIFNYMVKRRLIDIEEYVEEIVEKIDNPICKIETLCKTQLEVIYENRNFFKVIMDEVSAKQLRLIEFEDVFKKYVVKIEEYLIEAKDEGLIKQLDTCFMSYTFLGALTFTSIYELINNEIVNLEEVINNLIKYISYGFVK